MFVFFLDLLPIDLTSPHPLSPSTILCFGTISMGLLNLFAIAFSGSDEPQFNFIPLLLQKTLLFTDMTED